MSDTSDLDAVVVGAGWAGLGVSHALARRGLRHRVLERGRVGETWRSQRWDSFRMNTPNSRSVMPGDTYNGTDPDGFLTRDEFVVVLEDFARRNRLPIELDTPVVDLVSTDRGTYRLSTEGTTLKARNVVIASGSLNRPVRPGWAAIVPAGVLQLDASTYRNPSGLPPGAALVVGSGQSGGQIAEDLARVGRRVFLASGRTGRLPRRYRGQDITTWLLWSGLMDIPRKELVDSSGRIAPRPLLGAVHTISLQSLSAQGVVLLGRSEGLDSEGLFSFADDLEESIRFADEASANFKREIDDFIARAGIKAPAAEPDPAEIVSPRLPNPPIRSLDPAVSAITTVIWCTGFQGDFSWVRVPGVLDERGQPEHEEGIARIPGIYFAGLDFASTRKSGTILGIAEEAHRLAEHIAQRC